MTLRVSEFVGDWRVEGVGGPALGLRVGPTQLSVRQPDGEHWGYWVALPSGQFAFNITGASGDCARQWTGQSIPWLDAARHLDQDNDHWILKDGNGAVLVTLTPTTLPTASWVADDTPTPLTEGHRARLDRVLAPLPDQVSPATATDLAGRWVTRQEHHPAFGEFKADGRYAGSDGCNRFAAAWATDGQGSVLISQWLSTLIGCPHRVDIARWFSGTRASRQEDRLVLYDGRGNELHQLIRG